MREELRGRKEKSVMEEKDKSEAKMARKEKGG